MDDSLGCTIEKIKRQEQSKEVKLIAIREYEASKNNLQKSIRDCIGQTKNLKHENEDLLHKIDKLKAQLIIQKIRRDALSSQLEASTKEMKDLTTETAVVSLQVQELRSFYCDKVQDMSHVCDVWNLLSRPSQNETVPKLKNTIEPLHNKTQEKKDDINRLNIAIERREKAMAEKKRLLAEPAYGEEFVRIKNALRYSLEKSANLRK